jgi:hypothetical protein
MASGTDQALAMQAKAFGIPAFEFDNKCIGLLGERGMTTQTSLVPLAVVGGIVTQLAKQPRSHPVSVERITPLRVLVGMALAAIGRRKRGFQVSPGWWRITL